MYIARETYGWSRKKASISYGAISRHTGISRRNAIAVCQHLLKMGVLFSESKGDRRANVMGIQKNYSVWISNPVDNLVMLATLPSDAGDTMPSDADDTIKRQSSDAGDTRSSDAGDTTSKQKAIRLKQAENKEMLRPFKKTDQKAKLAALIKGHEGCITNCDPRPVIDALVGAGFDVMRVWGILVESRDKKNPPGYLVSTLCGSQFAVSDQALKKAKGEAEKWNYFSSTGCAIGASLVSSVANRLCVR